MYKDVICDVNSIKWQKGQSCIGVEFLRAIEIKLASIPIRLL